MNIKEVEKFAKKKLPEYYVKEHILFVVDKVNYLCDFYPEADREVALISGWLHDVVHPVAGYAKDDHNMASAKAAKEFLESANYNKNKLKKVIHCIKAHRTSRPPDPRTIEAKIVFSADNLSHFDNFDFMAKIMGTDEAYKKIQRDLTHKSMLPEAVEYAKKKMKKIKKKYNILCHS